VVVKPIQEEVVPRPLLEPQMSDANLESGPQKADLNWLEDDNADDYLSDMNGQDGEQDDIFESNGDVAKEDGSREVANVEIVEMF